MPGRKRTMLAGLLVALGLLATPALAQVLRTDGPTGRTGGEIRRGAVTASLRQRPFTENGLRGTRPVVTVTVNGQRVGQLVGSSAPFPAALVQIAEMDPANPYPEVLLSSFTGGAHCCNDTVVLTSDRSGRVWKPVRLGPFNGGTQPAEDPSRSGRFVIVSTDNRFLYRFDSYAGSYPPTRIWALEGLRFVDVSRQPQYRPLHRATFSRMQQTLAETPQAGNGVLAGYVATAALLDQFPMAWQQMLRRYDRSSDWGLTTCPGDRYDDQGRCRSREIVYKSFPEALRAFLIETGYIGDRQP